jgi:hypothetical protein
MWCRIACDLMYFGNLYQYWLVKTNHRDCVMRPPWASELHSLRSVDAGGMQIANQRAINSD